MNMEIDVLGTTALERLVRQQPKGVLQTSAQQ
jgi:hypothetical protein